MDPESGRATLVLPDSRRIPLDEDVVVGRAPIAPDDSPAARSLSLDVPTVSKTHALIGRTSRVIWLVDLHSSNGSEIIDATGNATSVVPGVKHAIAPGCHLRLGTDVVVTVERPLVDVDEATIVRTPSPPPVVPEQPGSDGRPLPAASAAVDWSAVMEPVPGAPIPPGAAPLPAATPPSLAPPPPPALQRAPVYSPSAPPTTQLPAVAAAEQPGWPGVPVPRTAPATAATGRSPAHVIGALVVLVWGVVGGWRLLEIGPDVLVENLSGWPARFFSLVSRDQFEFTELFSVVPTPQRLSPIVYVLAVVVTALALVALVVPSRTVRGLAVGAVMLQLLLIAGFAVDFFVAVGSDSLEFILPNFVLPVIGVVLLLWPSGSQQGAPSSFAPQSPPGVFYAPQQPPPPQGTPPFGGSS